VSHTEPQLEVDRSRKGALMTISYPRPLALKAAELDVYTKLYGSTVYEMDQGLSQAPGHSDLIDLTHGDTRAFLPPASALSDFNAAANENTEAYSPYRGSASVRERVTPRLSKLFGRSVDPMSELIITPGTQGGLFTALSAMVGPGDVVAYPSTEYFMDERITEYLGVSSHRLPLQQSEDGWLSIREGDLEAASRAGASVLLLSHPNNPTGGIYDRKSAELLAQWVVATNMMAIIDQLYCRLIFDGREYVHLGSLPGMAERTVTLTGPSKTESMSGYRVGVAVGPAPIIDSMERVISMTSLRTAGYAQHALRHWMDGDNEWLADRTSAHQEIRDRIVKHLRRYPGVQVSLPAGSSYIFPNISSTPWALRQGANNDFIFTKVLKASGVLVNPGYQFGLAGRGRFRINFSQDPARLERVFERLDNLLLR
jgi:aspartate/methionine/tyrosine aminotransferase